MAGILDQKTGLLTQAPTGTTINESGVVNRPITTESLKPTPALKLPDIPQQTSTEADTMLGGAGATAQNLQTITQQLTPQPTALDQQLQDLLGANVADTQQMAQKGADQLSAEQTQGIPQLKTQFGELNTQLAVKLAESKALDTSYQQANEQAKQGVFDPRIIQGKQQQVYRQYQLAKNAKASEIGLLQAQAQGISGQIGLAQETANRAVDLKYQAISDRLAIRQSQLNAIQPLLSKQEKIQAQAQQVLLDEQQRKIGEQKATDKQIQGLVLEAASKGASSAILSAISGAKTLVEAAQVFSKTTGSVPTNIPKGLSIPPTTIEGTLSSGAQAVADNPSLFSSYTPTEKGKIINELSGAGYDTTQLGAKPLSDSAIKQISDTQKAIDDLSVLQTSIDKNKQYIGPITGFARLNPWSKANQLQADINRVKQTVGKALEGGVLRKEDEEKYKKILPTMNDTPETVMYKLTQISASILKDIETYKSLQQTGGRSTNVNAPLTKKGSTKTGSTSGGNAYTISQE